MTDVIGEFTKPVMRVGDAVWVTEGKFIGFVKVKPRSNRLFSFITGLVVLGLVVYLVHYQWMWI